MSLAEVVAQLRTAVERLDQAVIGADRARADLAEAHKLLKAAGTGTDHNEIRDAIDNAATAAAKAGRLGSLLAKSATAFAKYGEHIMPCSMPTSQADPDTSLPDGEEILAQASRPRSWHQRISKKSVENAETAGDVTNKITQAIEAIGPQGSTSTGQQQPPPARPNTNYADSAESMAVIVSAIVALAFRKLDRRKTGRRTLDN